MQQIARALFVLPAFALAACATAPQVTNFGTTADLTTPAPADAAVLQAPAQTISTAAATTREVARISFAEIDSPARF